MCCDIGNLFLRQKQYEKALFWFHSALTLRENGLNGGFVSADASGFIPAIGLCICYDALGDYTKANEYNEIAGSCRPLSSSYLYNREYFKQKKINPY